MLIPRPSSSGSPRTSTPLLRSSLTVGLMSSHMKVSWWRTPLSKRRPLIGVDYESGRRQAEDEPSIIRVDMP